MLRSDVAFQANARRNRACKLCCLEVNASVTLWRSTFKKIEGANWKVLFKINNNTVKLLHCVIFAMMVHKRVINGKYMRKSNSCYVQAHARVIKGTGACTVNERYRYMHG